MTAVELIRQNPCPSHINRHGWIWHMACLCQEMSIPLAEAESAIRGGLSRPETGPTEVSDTVRNAYARPLTGETTEKTVLLDGDPVRVKELKYDAPSLARAVRDIPPISPAWLRERSPASPNTHPVDIMRRWVENNGEHVMAFDRMDSKTPALLVARDASGTHLLQSKTNRTGSDWEPAPEEDVREAFNTQEWPLGFWWLPQPVDGRWSTAEATGTRSCRSHFNVLAFRWLVLESDEAPPGLWLRYVVTLPGVGLVTTSGGKSIHALLRVDQTTREGFNRIVEKHKRHFVRLGADPLSLSAVRLTRLPGCFRKEKDQWQKLLYYNPDARPGGKAIW